MKRKNFIIIFICLVILILGMFITNIKQNSNTIITYSNIDEKF